MNELNNLLYNAAQNANASVPYDILKKRIDKRITQKKRRSAFVRYGAAAAVLVLTFAVGLPFLIDGMSLSAKDAAPHALFTTESKFKAAPTSGAEAPGVVAPGVVAPGVETPGVETPGVEVQGIAPEESSGLALEEFYPLPSSCVCDTSNPQDSASHSTSFETYSFSTSAHSSSIEFGAALCLIVLR